MPRIQDIGEFNAVREAGLSKLVPPVPRVTVGMGTKRVRFCGLVPASLYTLHG